MALTSTLNNKGESKLVVGRSDPKWTEGTGLVNPPPPEAGQARAAALQVRLTGNLQTSDPLASPPQRLPGGPALLPGHQTETHITAKPRRSICWGCNTCKDLEGLHARASSEGKVELYCEVSFQNLWRKTTVNTLINKWHIPLSLLNIGRKSDVRIFKSLIKTIPLLCLPL